MIRAMIDRLAHEPSDYSPDGHAARLARVMLDELAEMPRQRLNLPVSGDSRIRAIADALTAAPSDRAQFVEFGGKVLGPMVKRIAPDADAVSVVTMDDIEGLLAKL